MSGSVVTVAAVAKDGAIVIVTATDPGGLSATQSFGVTVPNRAPAAGDPIPDIEVFVGDEAGVDASGHFTDPDGDALTFTASTSAAGVARVSVSGPSVTIRGGCSRKRDDHHHRPRSGRVDRDADGQRDRHAIEPRGACRGDHPPSRTWRFATVFVARNILTITDVAPGMAVATVSASDHGGLSATQRTRITVEAPNRAPEPVGTPPKGVFAVGGDYRVLPELRAVADYGRIGIDGGVDLCHRRPAGSSGPQSVWRQTWPTTWRKRRSSGPS